MDTISKERIDKRVIKHDKNMVVNKMSHFWQDIYLLFLICFKQSSLIWLFQVKLEPNVMPRYLVESNCLISASSILILNDWLSLSLLEWKKNKIVLEHKAHFFLNYVLR